MSKAELCFRAHRARPLRAALALALALPACHAFDEGRRQAVTFTTVEAPEQVRERAVSWFSFQGYVLRQAELRVLSAERVREAEREVDVLSVRISEERDGTGVTVTGFTELLSDGSRRTADQVSTTTLRQTECLTEVLRRGLSPRLQC